MIKRLIDGLHDVFGCELGALLLISGRATLRLAIENGLAILVQFQLRHHNLGRVDSYVDGGPVNLLTSDALDVNDPLATVHLSHLPLAPLVRSTNDLHLVLFPHRNRANVVLGPELRRERSAHQHPPHARRRGEVSLTALAAAARYSWVELHRL